ncbi:MAG: cupredoxin domain-containing protein [Gemmatimonadota bacterium]|nr:MAG: cupredoxin domain-containing protein [Gemmatimonadota bacterium]
MNRSFAPSLAAVLGLIATACGGGNGGGAEETAATQQPAAEAEAGAAASLSMPEWMSVDEAAKTVTLDIIAGKDDSNNRWNFNGYSRGNGTVVVPVGYNVVINFRNDDPNIAHSIGVDARTGNFPATFQDPQPVFAGAISPNPTSMQEATQPGDSATISFTADQAGDYSLVCYIPAHAATGMWIHFAVSAEGEAGFASS